jgi:hypothetical protein
LLRQSLRPKVAARGCPGKAYNFDFDRTLLGVFFGQPHPGNFRIGKYYRRDAYRFKEDFYKKGRFWSIYYEIAR